MNKFKIILITFLVSFMAIGCNNNQAQNLSSQSSPTPLPTQTISVGQEKLLVELANDTTSQQQGLSNRNKLADGQGMLFDFSSSSIARPGFWMKDMKFSIDIIWINDGLIIGIEKDVPFQENNNNLPTYSPPSDITHVLEVPAGWSQKNNISIGDKVELQN